MIKIIFKTINYGVDGCNKPDNRTNCSNFKNIIEKHNLNISFKKKFELEKILFGIKKIVYYLEIMN